MRQNKGIFDS